MYYHSRTLGVLDPFKNWNYFLSCLFVLKNVWNVKNCLSRYQILKISQRSSKIVCISKMINGVAFGLSCFRIYGLKILKLSTESNRGRFLKGCNQMNWKFDKKIILISYTFMPRFSFLVWTVGEKITQIYGERTGFWKSLHFLLTFKYSINS